MMQKFIKIFIILYFIVNTNTVFANNEICIPTEQAKNLVQEIEQKRIMDKEIDDLYKLNEALTEQNKLLKDQTNLYKEQIQLQENKFTLCEKELSNEQKKGFFEKIKVGFGSLIMGALVGVAAIFLVK